MATIKKKDILEVKIDELINPDGSPIDGDERYNTTSQINVGVDKAGTGEPQITTDKAVQATRQGNRYYYGPQGLTYPGAAYHKTAVDATMGDDAELYETELDGEMTESMSLDKLAEEKMRKMVEDIVTNKAIGNDMVKKTNRPDVNRNNIPDIDELKSVKPVISNNTIQFVAELGNEPLQGDEKAIMLNYIISNLDLSDMSPDYKNILKNKI